MATVALPDIARNCCA